MDLGRIGVWWSGSWRHPDDPARSVAPELESLGYGALWSSGRFDPGLSPHFEKLLASTDHIPVASGIVSMWAGAPDDVGPAVAALEDRFPGRFLLGVGASHSVAVADYSRPYSKVVAYLDALDALPTPVPAQRRVLAALGPRMLELAAARTAGAHPYFVPVEHTAFARGILGRHTTPGPRGCRRARDRSRSGPESWHAATPARTSDCPTTRRTCAASASATTTSTMGEVTGSSTP